MFLFQRLSAQLGGDLRGFGSCFDFVNKSFERLPFLFGVEIRQAKFFFPQPRSK